MNIALIRGAFFNPYELQLYAPLAKRHNVSVISANWRLYPYPIELPGADIRYPRLSCAWTQLLSARGPLYANRLLSWTMGQSFILKGLESQIRQPDILHAAESFFTMTYQSLLIKRTLGCPLVVTVSENIPHSGETHPIRKTRKHAVLKEADLFLAITPTTRQMLLEEGVPESRIAIVPNCISTQTFAPGPKDPRLLETFRLSPTDLVVLVIARWVREKGIDDLLKVIPGIIQRKNLTHVRFCFVGSGPMERELRAAERQYPDHIRIIPFMPYSDMPAVHKLADIFVMASKQGPKINEQFGFVLAESMATSKPIITTRCGSIPDVVGDAAVLIPPGDPVALDESLVRLLNSEAERHIFGQRARARACEKFDGEKNSIYLEDLYSRLVKPL